MRVVKTTNYFFVGLSFLLALVLTLLPLPNWAIWFRPQFVFAFLLFWVIAAPLECGIALAWFLGLTLSLIIGTPFAEQAIVFVILIYVVIKLHPIIAHMPIWEQAVAVGILAAFNVIFQSFILGFTGHSTHIGLYSLSALTTALVWPAIATVLNHFRPRALMH